MEIEKDRLTSDYHTDSNKQIKSNIKRPVFNWLFYIKINSKY